MRQYLSDAPGRQCGACGAPVDADGQWTGDLPQYNEDPSANTSDDDPFEVDDMSDDEKDRAHQLLAEHPQWGANDARRVINRRRVQSAKEASDLKRGGMAPKPEQAQLAEIVIRRILPHSNERAAPCVRRRDEARAPRAADLSGAADRARLKDRAKKARVSSLGARLGSVLLAGPARA